MNESRTIVRNRPMINTVVSKNINGNNHSIVPIIHILMVISMLHYFQVRYMGKSNEVRRILMQSTCESGCTYVGEPARGGRRWMASNGNP